MKRNVILRLGAFLGLFCVACLSGASSNGAARAQENDANDSLYAAVPIAKSENRWIVVVDATPKEDEIADEYRDALDNLKNDFVRICGVDEDRVVVYSQYETNPEFHATRENILALLDALRFPESAEMKVPIGNDGFKKVETRSQADEIAEFQLYLIAKGVANPEQTKFAILPSDFDETQIAQIDDFDKLAESTIPIADVQRAMVECDPAFRPVERTLLVANFLSTVSTSRGDDAELAVAANFRDVDLDKIAQFRGGANDGGSVAVKLAEAAFFHGSVLVSNENLLEANRRSDAFFRVLRDGLDGFADVSGNGDSVVQADELLRYVREHDGGRGWRQPPLNGTDPFPICKTERKLKVPADLMKEIGETFASYQDKKTGKTVDPHPTERESAKKRYERLNAIEKAAR